MIRIKDTSWDSVINSEYAKDYFKELEKFVDSEYIPPKKTYPHQDLIFNAFELCPFDNVKVVIIGQDPYHGDGQAHGLAFSTMQPYPFPPSLLNIFTEINYDMPYKTIYNGDLTRWAKQGVLLLNSILTIEEGNDVSHSGKGWEKFTDAVIKKLSDEKKDLVFLLWGNLAISKGLIVNKSKHFVLEASHPSNLSAYRGFFGCKHFSQTNTYLSSKGISIINWR